MRTRRKCTARLAGPSSPGSGSGFSRADLLAVLAVLLLIVVLAIPSIGRAGAPSIALACVDNQRALAQAWLSFAADNDGELVNNYTIVEIQNTVAAKTYLNWTHSIMDWTVSSGNTNRELVRTSKLFPYLGGNDLAFKCPADLYLATAQRSRGWSERVRSYSMNGFMGRSSAATDSGVSQGLNPSFPQFRQFIRESSIPHPSGTFVFLDEHPDSINDGYYLNSPAGSSYWGDLPAAYHNGGAGVSFADGHAEVHAWAEPRTAVPVRFTYTSVPAAGSVDYAWLAARTSVDPAMLSLRRLTGDRLLIAWSAISTNYALQVSDSLATGSWTSLGAVPVKRSGQNSTEVPLATGRKFYRLRRP